MAKGLPKSRYTLFCQCPKALWLRVNKPDEATVDAGVEARFESGNEVGDLAMGLFGPFVEVTTKREDGSLDLKVMVDRTKEEMAKGTEVICEASFTYERQHRVENVMLDPDKPLFKCWMESHYCAVDILWKTLGGWAIYEVKSSSFPEFEGQEAKLEKYAPDIAYQKIQERMKEKGFRNGFACLFYGSPGTGKTETVYQLARKTGRSIMVVDVPRIKSKWVGESEKNIKALFDRYREQVKRAKLTPILLFNEADAIIGIRKNGASSAVDKMENSIQNIILQEMESLDGIMIATTNLQQNMDKAFERRFLYKIKFEKPTEEARTHIWHAMIPELSELDVHTLASKYDFSGGQIENIARHYAIDNILQGQSEDVLSMLIRHCDNERLDEKDMRKIGF
ncbi:MAG: ATP-binding protein [Prevotella sp.]|nr:ATP-binding protein [Prevotella sp.]MBR3480070.1 ATP-binding protein [Prevotella sp.]